jgi:beta-lactamase regulating signal transducer with metallopeptidase domain
MERLLIESAIRISLIAAGIAVVLRVMRIHTAAARHAAWTFVLISMLMLPAWTAFGPKTSIPILPARSQRAAAMTGPATEVSFAASTEKRSVPNNTDSSSATASTLSFAQILLAVYLTGVLVFLARLAIGTLRARRLIHKAVLQDGQLTSRACASPITVGWLKPVTILPDYWETWPKSQLHAVLDHEHAHARRRDPLIQWLALLNRALFWFHPLAWWLERRLAALAEESCDAAVLERGHDPQQYSEYLLDVARSVMRAGNRVDMMGTAMPGGFLPQRIRQIFDGD